MSGSGSWLVMIDSEKDVTFAAMAGALRKVKGATVGETAFGTTVEYEGCTIGVAYSDAPHVLVESKEIGERYGKAHRDKARIVRCARRFELTFHYEQVDVIMNVLCDIESELSLLVEEGGGKTFAFNPKSEEFF
jgi:hypothetical protein